MHYGRLERLANLSLHATNTMNRVNASLAMWERMRQSDLVNTDQILQDMLREQYREWVESQGDIRSVEL